MAEFTIEARSFDLDIPAIGRSIRHDFWVLRDSTGKAIAELNGLATDRKTLQYVRIGDDDKKFSLRVWQFVHDSNYASLIVDGAADLKTDTMIQDGQDAGGRPEVDSGP